MTLGSTANAERTRAVLKLRLGSPKRPNVLQDDPATLALFAPSLEPRLI